jgi:hypothetical protein
MEVMEPNPYLVLQIQLHDGVVCENVQRNLDWAGESPAAVIKQSQSQPAEAFKSFSRVDSARERFSMNNPEQANITLDSLEQTHSFKRVLTRTTAQLLCDGSSALRPTPSHSTTHYRRPLQHFSKCLFVPSSRQPALIFCK